MVSRSDRLACAIALFRRGMEYSSASASTTKWSKRVSEYMPMKTAIQRKTISPLAKREKMSKNGKAGLDMVPSQRGEPNPLEQPPSFQQSNVAVLIDKATAQLAGDIYKVLTELQFTRYYKLDNPRRLYTVVGWYLNDREARFSLRMRDEKNIIRQTITVD